MTADLRIEIGGAALARPRLNPICDLYDEVFSEPPSYWSDDESELHRERLLRLLEDPTFGITLALVGVELVGFAYGYTLPTDTKRWSRRVQSVVAFDLDGSVGQDSRGAQHVDLDRS